jgi:hypothetical protein
LPEVELYDDVDKEKAINKKSAPMKKYLTTVVPLPQINSDRSE